jgi:PKD repeat protein
LHPGSYFTCLTVVDSSGATCDWCDSVHVAPLPPPPVCNAHFYHYSGLNPDSIHFIPTGTPAFNYYWSFGDGSTSVLRDPWHFFYNPGAYTVCLMITDSINSIICYWCDTIVVTSFGSGATVIMNPNPTNQSASLSLLNFNTPVELRIYNVSGQMVYEKKNLFENILSINTENFIQGIYYYSIIDGTNYVAKGKLIVLH